MSASRAQPASEADDPAEVRACEALGGKEIAMAIDGLRTLRGSAAAKAGGLYCQYIVLGRVGYFFVVSEGVLISVT